MRFRAEWNRQPSGQIIQRAYRILSNQVELALKHDDTLNK